MFKLRERVLSLEAYPHASVEAIVCNDGAAFAAVRSVSGYVHIEHRDIDAVIEGLLKAKRVLNSTLEPETASQSYVGQVRWNATRTERIKVLGCYGVGSGGLLYSVTFPNSKALSPNGMSEEDIDAQYPEKDP